MKTYVDLGGYHPPRLSMKIKTAGDLLTGALARSRIVKKEKKSLDKRRSQFERGKKA